MINVIILKRDEAKLLANHSALFSIIINVIILKRDEAKLLANHSALFSTIINVIILKRDEAKLLANHSALFSTIINVIILIGNGTSCSRALYFKSSECVKLLARSLPELYSTQSYYHY